MSFRASSSRTSLVGSLACAIRSRLPLMLTAKRLRPDRPGCFFTLSQHCWQSEVILYRVTPFLLSTVMSLETWCIVGRNRQFWQKGLRAAFMQMSHLQGVVEEQALGTNVVLLAWNTLAWFDVLGCWDALVKTSGLGGGGGRALVSLSWGAGGLPVDGSGGAARGGPRGGSGEALCLCLCFGMALAALATHRRSSGGAIGDTWGAALATPRRSSRWAAIGATLGGRQKAAVQVLGCA